MNKLFQVLIFSMLILIVGETTVSASESDWDTYTTTDKLTGKKSDPFLRYHATIPGASKGRLKLQVRCIGEDVAQKLDQGSPFGNIFSTLSLNSLFSNPTEIKDNDHFRSVIHSIHDYDESGLKSVRQLNIDDALTFPKVIVSESYRNVYLSLVQSSKTNSNYSNLAKKQELVFDDGNSMIIEFGQKYLKYVRSCFAGRVCQSDATDQRQYAKCDPAL